MCLATHWIADLFIYWYYLKSISILYCAEKFQFSFSFVLNVKVSQIFSYGLKNIYLFKYGMQWTESSISPIFSISSGMIWRKKCVFCLVWQLLEIVPSSFMEHRANSGSIKFHIFHAVPHHIPMFHTTSLFKQAADGGKVCTRG